MVQVPAWVLVPIGSCEVFAIAIPVSNPDWLVTNGNNSNVWQIVTATMFLAVEVSANLGIVKLPDADEPAVALNGMVGVGAKLRLIVPVPGAGELFGTFAEV